MNRVWWRVSLVLLVSILQTSFVSLVWPTITAPALVFSVVISIILVRGFREGVGEWMMLLFVTDILQTGELTILVPYGICIAYVTSFISRRFLFEHQGMALFLLALLGGGINGGYSFLVHWLEVGAENIGQILSGVLLGGLIFFPVFFFVRIFEKKIEQWAQAEFRGLR